MAFTRTRNEEGVRAVDNNFNENIQMTNRPLLVSREKDDRKPYWFDVRHLKKRNIVIFAIALVVVIVVVITVAVMEVKANPYPNYSQLTYTLKDTFSGTSFFNNFDYFTGYDPTKGFVHYLDVDQAKQFNLTSATTTSAILKVDTTVGNASTGRYSVRIMSKKQYDTGLFIFDVKHTPYGCGTWPALWLTDPSNWPNNGEIDVMEAVNQATNGNQMTLHTTGNCSMSVKRKETGSVLTTDCYNGTDSNAGCGVLGTSFSYGATFNAATGGLMAMELRSAGIRVWQFARANVPLDITNGTPDPSTWPEATADFPSTNCNISSHFRNQSIIANIDLCGTWAGSSAVYTTLDQCPLSCTQYVQSYPQNFADAYWEFGNFTVYSAVEV